MPGPTVPNPKGEHLAPVAQQVAGLRADLDQLDEAISAVVDLPTRDQCMAMSQAIRVGLDRLDDAVA